MISRNSTHLVLISLILGTQITNLFFLRGYGQWERDILRQQALYNAGTFAFDPKEKYKKVDDLRPSKDASLEIFWDRKNWKIFENFHWNLYENENFWDRKFSKFFDLKNFRIFHWKMYENEKFWDRNFSKIFDLKIFRGMHLWMDADHRLINIFPSDQKHSSRNCIKFAVVKYLVLNVDSRWERKL